MKYLEVNLKNAEFNYNYIKNRFKKEMICVVKSDAYGHGAKELSSLLQNNGCKYFAVATSDEAIYLRNCGVKGEILILGYTPPENVLLLKKYCLTQSLISSSYARTLNDFAYKNQAIISANIKIDTGMSRFGFSFKEEDYPRILDAFNLKNLSITGLYTHFCMANEPNNVLNLLQTERFCRVKDYIKNEVGKKKLFIHASNTAALFNGVYSGGDGVRIGLGLYGFGDSSLKPLLTLKTKLVHVSKVKAGASVGYGGKYVFSNDGFVGIIPVGYNDGFFVKSDKNNKYFVKINNYEYPVIGEVCMNHTFIDLSNSPKTPALPKISDEVTVIDEYSFSRFSKVSGRSVYCALTSIGRLNEKIYLR